MFPPPPGDGARPPPTAGIAGARPGHPGLVTDPEAHRPGRPSEDQQDEQPAFDIDLDPEDQGTAEAAEEQTG